MPNDKTAFLQGMLATYFGFASELADIRDKNPNLNFDAAPLPQLRAGGVKADYGKIFGFSLVRSSANVDTAYQVISILTSAQYLADLAQTMYLPSVRRDVIARGNNDPYITIFNKAALIANTWIDADPAQSRQIFAGMVDSLTSGRKDIYQAIQDAGDQYDLVLKQAVQ